MAIDWPLYEEDVIRIYVDNNKTINETIKYLQEKRGIKVRQVVPVRKIKFQKASKFGGLKKLSANEWKAVIKGIRTRQDEGKVSDVYHHGRKLDPDRVMREVRRYSKGCNGDLVEESTSTEVTLDLYNRNRIEIRTPSPSGIQRQPTPVSADLQIQNIEFQPGIIEGPQAELTNDELCLASEFDLDIMDIDFSTSRADIQSDIWDGFQTPCISSSDNTILPNYSLLLTTDEPYTMLGARSEQILPFRQRYHSNFEDSTFISSLALCSVISWQGVTLPYLCSSPEIFSTILNLGNGHDSVPLNEVCVLDWDQSQTRVPPQRHGWLLSHLIAVNPKLEALKSGADLAEQVLSGRPTRPQGGFDEVFYYPDQQCVYQLFSISTYLISNNRMSSAQRSNFLSWVFTRKLEDQLSIFMRNSSVSIRACIETILLGLVELSNRYPSEVQKLLDLIISTTHYFDMSDTSGGRLLHLLAGQSARSPHLMEVVNLLLSRGADINFVMTLSRDFNQTGTPLCNAILAGNHLMVQYLIGAGADINLRAKVKSSEVEVTALTMAIQSKDFGIAKVLLDAVAEVDTYIKIGDSNILELARSCLPKIYLELLEKLTPENARQVYQLIDAAEKGNRILSQFLFKNDIFQEEILEHALCHAIKLASVGASRTLLQRGIDPNARRSQLVHCTLEDGHNLEHDPPIVTAASISNQNVALDLFYLLVKAGADLSEETQMRICESAVKYGGVAMLAVTDKTGFRPSLFGPSALEILGPLGYIYDIGVFLDEGTPINDYGIKGLSGLQAAAGSGQMTLMQYLIDRGADINLLPNNDNGRTALQAAALGGFTEIVDYLIDLGADVKLPPAARNGVTALEAAAGVPEWQPIRQYGVHSSEEKKPEEGKRELISTFKKLLALGAPVIRSDGSSSDILHRLIRRSRHECLELSIKAGARIEDRETSEGMKTPLQVTAEVRNMKAIKLLLEIGAEINAPAGDEFGRTALQAASSAEIPDPRMIEYLLRNGAEINAPPARKGGITALQGAAIRGDIQIARMLVMKGADVNAKAAPEEGRTAIEGAAEHGRLDMVRFLLSQGAKPQPFVGFSRAVELANDNGHFVLAGLLREHENSHNSLLAGAEFDDQIFGSTSLWLSQGMIIHDSDI
ncbi:hypothetical protein BP6252_13244 [Coleophoma cylindrospora]|uniref:Uncharacterized protein n=1 Tax=Coleophoma cylindrospora TaxID=1849047 RepID=A0A3D8QAX7_9HELO|nr:hypothetical protein BP6252_13244 [Coleophoma cylindrospora]